MANRNVLINEDSLIGVADAIRGVTGSSAGLRVADMPSAISAYGAAASSDITALGGQIDAILENHGEKNLLVLSAKTTTANGITYTVNSDGSIHVSGTASGYSSLNVGTFTGINGQTYILTGCPQGGDSRTYVLGIDGTNYSDTGDGVSFTSDGTPKTIYIGVLSQTIDTTFYPMVRDSRIISSSYVKYNGDVDVVWENNGQKNLLPNNATTTTINGITFTVNSDGTIKANGTASGGNATLVMYKGLFEGYEGYLFTGCPSGGGGSTYFMAIEESGGNYQIFGRDNGEGGILSGQGSTVCNAYIRINNGTTVSNLVFKPMLRDVRIASDEYVPRLKSRMIVKEDITVSLTSGAYTYTYPDGITNTEYFLPMLIPMYISGGIVGWGYTLQQSGDTACNIYVRQGTTVPANNTQVRFTAIWIHR